MLGSDRFSEVSVMDLKTHLAVLRDAAANGRVLWRRHALERLLERGISRPEV